ncbi:PIN domain-containing protein [Propionimicrobium sp. PCR01-08-3]|uniref:PIN domain-containing protein n=1 Tax=Propionimicrobium sp. PCR01-08-3 TaxID=3052086 RepID=UPI00255CF979|nr:PIN domain-containing protein [Propionimicrobium sp. PCR01-08-3]WIY83842.1 PIN domain-containing protein [Propionimicrobium sp. PCR01-08-3]
MSLSARRVLADTNIPVSAFIFPSSVPDQALQHILSFDRLVLTNWILEEFDRIIETKWPERIEAARTMIAALKYELAEPTAIELQISDPNGQPILEAAVTSAVDIIVTGDKRFFALELARPQIVTARQFLSSLT